MMTIDGDDGAIKNRQFYEVFLRFSKEFLIIFLTTRYNLNGVIKAVNNDMVHFYQAPFICLRV